MNPVLPHCSRLTPSSACSGSARRVVLLAAGILASLAVLAVSALGAFVSSADTTFTSALTVADALPHAPGRVPVPAPVRREPISPGEYSDSLLPSSPVPPPAPRGTNILLMGSDSRQGANSQGYGDPEVYSNERSDTSILVHVADDRSFATAVSIPRDTWVSIPACPRLDGSRSERHESKFNAAFELGGPACTARLVEEMTGLRVDHFAVVDFAGFKKIVDELGGVEVCLAQPADDPSSGLSLPAGTSTLDGEQALSYVRARKSLGDGSDIGRIKRQQAFLAAMTRSVLSAGILLDPPRLLRVLEAVGSSLTVDKDLAAPGAARDLAWGMRTLSAKNVTFVTMPWLPRGDGENVVVSPSAADALWRSMAEDRPWLSPGGSRRGSHATDPVADPMSADEKRC